MILKKLKGTREMKESKQMRAKSSENKELNLYHCAVHRT